MTVSIDRAGCIGCGNCEGLCPEVFQIQDDGLASVVGQPDGNLEQAAQEAASSCPVNVIHCVDE